MAKIEWNVVGNVGVVTLNRPDSLNALDNESNALLQQIWKSVGLQPAVRALVVTGSGRGFCVGLDLKEVGATGTFRATASDRVSDVQNMTALSNDVWLPTIVAVNGICAGGGLHFVADADYVLASTDASFVDPHVGVGQVSALEPISLMPRIGIGAALRLAVLGKAGRMSAAEALRVGLVDELVEPGSLVQRAHEIAAAAAANSPAAMERTKRAIWQATELPMSEAMQRGLDSLIAHRGHPDALEGPRAFAERRPPRWA